MTKIIFNEQQQQAVDHHKGALGVIASAGSGKSATLLGRIDNLITKHKVFQKDILCISFTNATATELKEKLAKMGHKHVNVGTFHSICARILFQEGYKLTGYNLIKEWQIDNVFKGIDKKADVKDIQNFISYQKNYKRSYDDSFIEKESNYSTDQLREFFKAYEQYKKKHKLYDFDDYLLLCLEVVQKNPGKHTFEYVLVDEHQDSNLVQNELLKEWCESGNIFVVFDPKQAIYSFRAGNIEYCMNFHKDWEDAEVVNLFTNYRSANNIVEQSNHFIRKYFKDYEYYTDAKSNNSNNGQIKVNHYSSQAEEAQRVVDKIEKLINDDVSLNEIAVLYRLNKHADFVEAELKRRDIDYEIANDSSFFKRREIAGINAYLRLLQDIHDDNAFETIFKFRNYPLKFFSNNVLDDAIDYADKNDVSLYSAFSNIELKKPWMKNNINEFSQNIQMLSMQAKKGVGVEKLIDSIYKFFRIKEYIYDNYSNQDEIEERIRSVSVLKSFVRNNNLEQFITYVYSSNTKKKSKKNAVKLMSVHRSKGLEFDNVFLIGVEDSQFPHDREGTDIDEEARLFYVAVTRPKEKLFISEIGVNNKFIEGIWD